MKRLVALALAFMAIQMTASASDTTVRVIDGDTIDVDGRRHRLHGIDAPEMHQTCADGFPAGIEATKYLRQLINGSNDVKCDLRD